MEEKNKSSNKSVEYIKKILCTKLQNIKDNLFSNESFADNELLPFCRNLALLLAFYLYFIGWIYVYTYFNYFGIAMSCVDIPFYYFFVYSYSVIISCWIKIVIFGILIFIFIAANKNNFSASKLAKKSLIILFLVIVIPISYNMARFAGEEDAENKRKSKTNTIKLFFKPNMEHSLPDDLISANHEGKLKLLTQTDTRLFCIFQPEDVDNYNVTPRCYVYDIPLSNVVLDKTELQCIY